MNVLVNQLSLKLLSERLCEQLDYRSQCVTNKMKAISSGIAKA